MSAPSTRRRRIDEIGEESRRRILDAAEELFAEKGFDRTSFVDIGQRSGISRGSIPWHFENKDGLLMAVVERVVERYMTTNADDPSEVSMQDMMVELRQLLYSGPPDLLYMILTEAMTTEGLVHEQYVNFFKGRRKVLAQWMLLRDATSRLSPTDAKAMAAILNGALLGIQLQWQLDKESIDLDRTLDLFASLVDNFLAGTLAPFSEAAKPKRALRKVDAQGTAT
jgi:TetR/AcrR family acrAB operon transcriptional repressor